MVITFITTLHHNIGDDFVRAGLIYLFKKLYNRTPLQFEFVHKHVPITVRKGFENYKITKKFNKYDHRFKSHPRRDRILMADLVVQSGAPVFWCHPNVNAHCYINEWYEPLIKRRFELNPRAKFLTLAAGSCQSYHSNGTEFCEPCNQFINELYCKSFITTLRDPLARIILNQIGYDAPVHLCSSVFAPEYYNIKNQGAEYIVMNYMSSAGHYSFGRTINTNQWRRTFTQCYDALKKSHQIVLVCHNDQEKKWALSIDSTAEIFISNRPEDYIRCYAHAKCGIVNRVHAAMILGSLGKPSFLIANDSRARMAELMGVHHVFVNDVNTDVIMEKAIQFLTKESPVVEEIRTLKQNAFGGYMEALSAL